MFDNFGFEAPFAFAASLLLVLACVMLLLPVSPAAMAPAPKANAPTWQLLRVGAVMAPLAAMWSVHSSITFLAPTLQPFLAAAPFELKSSTIGLVFMGCTFGFASMAALAGTISAAIGYAHQMILGLVFIATGYLLVGPSPLAAHFLDPSIQITLVALLLAAMGGGLAMVPASPLMLRGAEAAGYGTSESTDAVAALATLGGSFGGFSGSMLGGAFAEVFDFPTAAASFAVLPLLVIPFLLPYRVLRSRELH